MTEFGRAEGVSLPSLYAWRRKTRESEPAFAQVSVGLPGESTAVQGAQITATGVAAADVEIRMPGGEVVRVSPGRVDVAQLRAVLQALGGSR